MIDLQKELEKYAAIEVENHKKSLYRFDSNIEESVKLYNKALESIKAKKSQDIAIIELKKSIKLRANFFEAINLLGLCYYNRGEKDNAKKCFQSIIKNDPNCDLALKYLSVIKDEKFFRELGLDFVKDEENLDLTEKELKKNFLVSFLSFEFIFTLSTTESKRNKKICSWDYNRLNLCFDNEFTILFWSKKKLKRYSITNK